MTRDFVDRVRLLINRLNAITLGLIGDQTYITILLTQIGSEYAFIVDAIQNDKELGTPVAVGNRLANAERVVRGKDLVSSLVSSAALIHVIIPVKKSIRISGHKGTVCPIQTGVIRVYPAIQAIDQARKKTGRAYWLLRDQEYIRAKVTTFYTHVPDPRWIMDSAATSHVCWDRECFTSLRQHREMLMTAGDPVEAEGIGTVKLSIRGKPH
ncbi:hypothetical protein FE257_006689 [Aspergillus nanangensis]|uniref:Retrovirus-related Pol polyprotein from transposon TNT 1-94-like beta-barrel domain-containing protein n=1 Tax=Aspergillus nanangensis TaxID=2582783 RepID=A0AAD4GTW7_ASPNN|nr:hypothetical protein FE257_006689 [Aspergillus nanangensis]